MTRPVDAGVAAAVVGDQRVEVVPADAGRQMGLMACAVAALAAGAALSRRPSR